jgi:NAD(P)H-hydrate epimerase
VKLVTSDEMRQIDKSTIEQYGVPSLILMERAGLSVAQKVRELYKTGKIIVLCGKGNNGGDGLVVARILQNWGYRVKAFLLGEKVSLSPDCEVQYKIAKKFNVPIELKSAISSSALHGAIIIDAIFGTGLNKPVGKNLVEIFNMANNSSSPVFSIDIASGISADTGEVLGAAIKADYTITFGLPKLGHILYPGADYSGKLFVEDIGFPPQLLNSETLKVELIQKDSVSSFIKPRERYSHKGDYGHVLIIAGSKGKTGAALMCAKACLRSGAGLVTIGVPESLIGVMQGRITEEMTLPLADDGKGMFSINAIDKILSFISSKIQAVAIGPGIGISPDTEMLVAEIIKTSPVALIIDADGINSLSANPDTLKQAKSSVVLTPHPGEMARLCSRALNSTYKTFDIEKDRLGITSRLSCEYGVNVVLKGVPSVIASPDGRVFVNISGNPGMATGGSGDVLTGIIASFVGQGLNPLNASISGVYIHGLAGDLASEKKGEYSMIASDLIESMPDAFRYLSTSKDRRLRGL